MAAERAMMIVRGGFVCVPMWLGVLELAGCNCNSNTNLDEGSSSSSTGADESSSTGVATTQTTSAATTNATSSSGGDEVGGTTGVTGGHDDQCHGPADCDEGSFCVAPYADNERGDFACVAECVGPMDEDSWCYDASACCDPAAVCTIRGYCEVEGADASTSGTTGGGDGTSSSSTG